MRARRYRGRHRVRLSRSALPNPALGRKSLGWPQQRGWMLLRAVVRKPCFPMPSQSRVRLPHTIRTAFPYSSCYAASPPISDLRLHEAH